MCRLLETQSRSTRSDFLKRSCEFWVELWFIWTDETVTGSGLIASSSSTLHRSPCLFFFSPLSRKIELTDFSTDDCRGAWPWCSVGWQCLPPPPLSFSLVLSQAAINQAFIPGIKVTFRSRVHALMLWKAEWSGGGRQIERHWLGWGLGGGGGWSCGHNAVVVTSVVETIRSWCYISIRSQTQERQRESRWFSK